MIRCRATGPLFAILLLSPVLPAQSVIPAKPRHAAVAEALDRFITREVQAKHLPALSVALVDDQSIVWAKGFGFADPDRRVPATAETVYRVGSVSKLFTDLAIMQLVEQGMLDLDAPVDRYLPDFKPANPFDKPITLRQLMAHRSGLVREPPVGNYFDPTNPTLAETVRSLNRTTLVYPPESRIKYSNAGIAVVGYVLEVTQKERFPAYLQRKVLAPMGLSRSSFEATPELMRDLAAAYMWTYEGRQFEAPTFPLGMAPAGSLCATVLDLGRFLTVLFNGGRGPGGQVVRAETVRQMWTPQFAKADEKRGFGIGFHLSEFDGRRRVGHGGAVYGFATSLEALPEEKLGVVVVTSRDVANAVTGRIADLALSYLLAVREGKPLPSIEETQTLSSEEANCLAGRYVRDDGKGGVDLIASAGRLYLEPFRGGARVQLSKLGDSLITDDLHDYGKKLVVQGDSLSYSGQVFKRVAVPKPSPCPEKWLGLIGEYGWDHNVLFIYEKDGRLYALVEWIEINPLEEESPDVFRLPSSGCMYHGEKVVFTRDGSGKATRAEFAGIVFRRRPLVGENGSTFRIRPLRPVEELRREARAASPPREELAFAVPDLVELTTLDPTLKLDIRYATDNNFLGVPVYDQARAFLQRPAAEAVVRVHRKLKEQGYGLLIHDAYRPWYVTKIFWEATPPANRIFVANPAEGSRHNRGCAVDLTLFDLATGKPVAMVSGYDEMSARSYSDYPGGTSQQRWHRDLLRRVMESEGFTVYPAEWWHFDHRDWKKYAIMNFDFQKLPSGQQQAPP